jgi:hypothetical protein
MKMNISLHNKDIFSKYTSTLFKDSIFEYYGVKSTAKVKEFLNVELPDMEITKLSADLICLMDDDTCNHWEFQTSFKIEDLTRFSRYDSLIFDREKRTVNTIIVYSADVKEIIEKINIGSMKYEPTSIMMNKYDGDSIFSELELKFKEKQELTDIDILNLIFLPLMKSNIPKFELAKKSIELAKMIEDERKQETCLVSAVAFSVKYLSEAEIIELWEGIKMVNVISKLIREEYQQELQDERKKRDVELAKSLLDVLAVEVIAKKFGMTVEEVEELKKEQPQEEEK